MRITALMIVLLWPMSAWADQSLPLFYSRTQVTIIRQHPPVIPPMPWQQDQKVETQPPGIIFDAELRDATTLYNQEGWFNLSSLSDNTAIMLAFAAPGLSPLVRLSDYTPLDVLLVDQEGKIIQIVPTIVLADLKQEILPPAPILAMIFLKGGTCARLSIAPGDVVDDPLFKKPPAVLTVPVNASSPANQLPSK